MMENPPVLSDLRRLVVAYQIGSVSEGITDVETPILPPHLAKLRQDVLHTRALLLASVGIHVADESYVGPIDSTMLAAVRVEIDKQQKLTAKNAIAELSKSGLFPTEALTNGAVSRAKAADGRRPSIDSLLSLSRADGAVFPDKMLHQTAKTALFHNDITNVTKKDAEIGSAVSRMQLGTRAVLPAQSSAAESAVNTHQQTAEYKRSRHENTAIMHRSDFGESGITSAELGEKCAMPAIVDRAAQRSTAQHPDFTAKYDKPASYDHIRPQNDRHTFTGAAHGTASDAYPTFRGRDGSSGQTTQRSQTHYHLNTSTATYSDIADPLLMPSEGTASRQMVSREIKELIAFASPAAAKILKTALRGLKRRGEEGADGEGRVKERTGGEGRVEERAGGDMRRGERTGGDSRGGELAREERRGEERTSEERRGEEWTDRERRAEERALEWRRGEERRAVVGEYEEQTRGAGNTETHPGKKHDECVTARQDTMQDNVGLSMAESHNTSLCGDITLGDCTWEGSGLEADSPSQAAADDYAAYELQFTAKSNADSPCYRIAASPEISETRDLGRVGDTSNTHFFHPEPGMREVSSHLSTSNSVSFPVRLASFDRPMADAVCEQLVVSSALTNLKSDTTQAGKSEISTSPLQPPLQLAAPVDSTARCSSTSPRSTNSNYAHMDRLHCHTPPVMTSASEQVKVQVHTGGDWQERVPRGMPKIECASTTKTDGCAFAATVSDHALVDSAFDNADMADLADYHDAMNITVLHPGHESMSLRASAYLQPKRAEHTPAADFEDTSPTISCVASKSAMYRDNLGCDAIAPEAEAESSRTPRREFVEVRQAKASHRSVVRASIPGEYGESTTRSTLGRADESGRQRAVERIQKWSAKTKVLTAQQQADAQLRAERMKRLKEESRARIRSRSTRALHGRADSAMIEIPDNETVAAASINSMCFPTMSEIAAGFRETDSVNARSLRSKHTGTSSTTDCHSSDGSACKAEPLTSSVHRRLEAEAAIAEQARSRAAQRAKERKADLQSRQEAEAKRKSEEEGAKWAERDRRISAFLRRQQALQQMQHIQGSQPRSTADTSTVLKQVAAVASSMARPAPAVPAPPPRRKTNTTIVDHDRFLDEISMLGITHINDAPRQARGSDLEGPTDPHMHAMPDAVEVPERGDPASQPAATDDWLTELYSLHVPSIEHLDAAMNQQMQIASPQLLVFPTSESENAKSSGDGQGAPQDCEQELEVLPSQSSFLDTDGDMFAWLVDG